MSMLDEFKDFAMKGNVLDLAVGVIMGAAFAPIVSTLVDNIVMPPIGYLMAGIDFSTLAVNLPTAGDPVLIKYGLFLNAVIKFAITAAAIFLLIKALNTSKCLGP
jgi:large conductance mechanosensitive channel